MFSNRAFFWKFWLALVALAGLSAYAARQGRSLNPAVWRAVGHPERWEGAPLWFNAIVVSKDDDGAVVRSGEMDLAVRGRLDAARGASVEVSGIFRRDGPHLELLDWRPVPPESSWRWLLEAVSLVVLLGVGWNLLRHFAFRPRALHAEAAD